MKVLLAVIVALVAVVPVGAQVSQTKEKTEEERVVESLNAQFAKMEDSAGLGGEGYRAKLSGNAMFCEFFAQIQQMYPVYKGATCQVRN
jgi:hypothetical protein